MKTDEKPQKKICRYCRKAIKRKDTYLGSVQPESYAHFDCFMADQPKVITAATAIPKADPTTLIGKIRLHREKFGSGLYEAKVAVEGGWKP